MRDLPDAVLFACTHNSVRSAMAEGLMKKLHGNRVYVDSVGVHQGRIDPMAVEVMDELGVDLSHHRAKTFDMLADAFFDVIVSLSPEAQHSAVEMTRTMACDVEFWPTLDPTAMEGSRQQKLDAYRQVRDTLLARLKKRFPLDLNPSP